MTHTKAFYEERREKRATQRKEYRDNRSEEKNAYRKLFNKAGKAGTPTLDPSPTGRDREGLKD